ncbi:MAG: exodeoxyribonuclease III [Limnochordia bacterium]
MRLVSWNVNGIRACLRRGFMDFFNQSGSDFFCLQETRVQPGQVELELPGYEQYWNYALQKKGYSGTAIFTRHTPISQSYGIGHEEHDQEGRTITLEYDNFYLVTVYTPNSQRGLTRLGYRMRWEDDFRRYLLDLNTAKPVIVCGDLNVAHKEIDLKNPETNRTSAGFTAEERAKFTKLLEAGFIDTFRYFYPDRADAYTWWSNFFNARERNIGWRIDYFLVSRELEGKLVDAKIHDQVFGSDHCPVELELEFTV